MNRRTHRFISAITIVALVMPQTLLAQTTQLNTFFSTDTGSSGSLELNASGGAATNNNLNPLAPTTTTTQRVGGNWVTTTRTPSIDLDGTKKEGVWNLRVSRYGENAVGTIRHDLTAPKCPPAPSNAQYQNETDYYTVNKFKNPWPRGLDGEWETDVIEFYDNDPLLCRDQIKIDGNNYVKRAANNTSVLGNKAACEAKNFYYKEDFDDCMKGFTKTRPRAQMAGCFSGAGDVVVFDQHGVTRPFYMKDTVNNRTAERCPTPIAKIDSAAPTATSINVEHAGLELPKEKLGTNQANRNIYRADDGSLFLHANLTDPAKAGSGVSGVNWETIQSDPNNRDLEHQIGLKENEISDTQQNLNIAKANLIITRSNILSDITTQLNQLTLNNIWAKVTKEINTNTNTAFNQSIGTIINGSTQLESSNFNNQDFDTIVSLLQQKKFEDVEFIDEYITQLSNLNANRPNQLLSTYQSALLQSLNYVRISQLGDSQVVENTKNDFSTYYNQWQIDKAENYSHVVPNWLTTIAETDDFIEANYDDYTVLDNRLKTDTLEQLSDTIGPFSTNQTLLGLTNNIVNASSTHTTRQQQVSTAFATSNGRLNSIKQYLQNFDPSTDNFDVNQMVLAQQAWQEASNAVATINGDLDTSAGALGAPVQTLHAVMQGGEASTIVETLETDTRRINNRISTNEVLLETLEVQVAQLENTQTLLNDQLLVLRTQLADAVSSVSQDAKTTVTEDVNQQIGSISGYQNKNFNTDYQANDPGLLMIRDDAEGTAECTYEALIDGKEVARAKAKDWVDGHLMVPVPKGALYQVKQYSAGGNMSKCGGSWLRYAPLKTKISSSVKAYKDRSFNTKHTTTKAGIVVVRDDAQGSANCTYIGKVDNAEITRTKAKDWSDARMSFVVPAGSSYEVETKFSQCDNSWMKFVEIDSGATSAFGGYQDVNFNTNYFSKTGGIAVIRDDAGGGAECTYVGKINGSEITRSKAKGWVDGHMTLVVPSGTTYRIDQFSASGDMKKCGGSWAKFTPFTAEEVVTEEKQVQTFKEDKISHLEISRLTGNKKNEQFFPPNITPVSGDNYKWDLNLYKFRDENQPIFSVAGLYKITIRLYDKAGNDVEKNGFIDIKPAKLEVSATTNCNSAVNTHYADMQDTCNIVLPQFDRFGNKIASNKDLKLTVRDQDTNGSYNLITELGQNYQNGLRFVGGNFVGNKHQLKWKPSGADEKAVKLKSLLPTITVLQHKDDPTLAAGFTANTGFDLPLVLEHPEISPRGNVLATPLVDNVDLKVNFKPLLNVTLSDRSGPPSTTTWNVNTGTQFPVFAQADTDNPSKNLPSNFNINVTGVSQDGFKMENEDLSRPGKTLNFTGVNSWQVESGQPGTPTTPRTTIVSTSALSGQQELRPLFVPTSAYQLADSPASPKTIITPGLPLGAFVPVTLPPVNPPDLQISNASAEEGQRLRFNLILSKPADVDTVVYLTTTDGTATVVDDYNYNPSIGVTIPKGVSEVEYSIPTADDKIVEESEKFTLSVDSHEPSGAIANSNISAEATIEDNDNTLYIYDGTVEEGGMCEIGVSLHRPSDEDITVEIEMGDVSDSAQAGSDYDINSVSGTIPAGSSTILLSIPTIEDELEEAEESFTVDIVSVSGGGLTDFTTESKCYIHDDDVQANISVLSNSTAYEGDNVQVTIALDRAENEDIRLSLETFDTESTDGSTATENEDYIPRSFDVTIPAGTLAIAAPASGIKTKDDLLIEDDETFGVRITDVLSGEVGSTDGVGIVTIIDDTPLIPPSLHLINPEFEAENTPENAMNFTVILDRPNITNSGDDLVMVFELEDITATGGADYDNSDLTVTIPAGEQSGVIGPIRITDDEDVEAAEKFRVKHKSTTSGVLIDASAEGIGTIIDNDEAPPSLFIDDSSAIEGTRVMNFTARLSKPHFDNNNSPLVVNFTPAPQTATAGSDFTAGQYRATFNIGQSEANLEPVILIDDADVETSENFTMNFAGVTSGHPIGDTSDTAIGTIIDDDVNPLPNLIINNPETITEGSTAEFAVKLDRAPESDVVVTFTAFSPANPSAATISSDYQAKTLNVAFTPTNYEATVSVSTVDDSVIESAEIFSLKGVPTDPSQLGDASSIGSVIITDNDKPAPTVPSLILFDAQPALEGSDLIFHAALTETTTEDIRFNLRTVDVTAERGVDFDAPALITVNIPAGTSAGNKIELAPINTIQDDLNEVTEFLSLEFANSLTGDLDDTSQVANASILNSYNPPSIIINDASALEGGRAEFDVLLDRPDHDGVSITFKSVDDTAQSPADYLCPADQTTLVFAPGEMGPLTVGCDIENDQINEPIEEFSLAVESVVGNVKTGGDSDIGKGYITNVQTVELRVETPGVVMEDDPSGLVEFTVNLYDEGVPIGASLENDMSVTFEPQDLVAIGGTSFFEDEVDFRSGPITTIFKAGKGEGSTTLKVGVAINDDNNKEVNQTFNTSPENRQENFLMVPTVFSDTVRLANAAQGYIQDEDSFKCDDDARVYVRDGQAVEGDQMYFDVSMSESLCKGVVTLNFRTVDGSASEASDYDGGTYTVEIPRYSKRPKKADRLLIPTTFDTLDEENENFQLEFVSATPASYVTRVERKKFRKDGSLQDLGTVPIEGTIMDDDDTPEGAVTPDLSIENASSVEGNDLEFLVRLSEPNPDETTRIRFQASTNGFSNPATSGTDFSPTIATVSIAAGQGAGIAQVSTTDDNSIETDESLLVSYRSLLAGNLNNVSDTGVGTIVDNDALEVIPAVVINDSSALEGNDMSFTIRLEDPNTGDPMTAPDGGIGFDITVASGSAIKDVDFAGGRSVTIPPNESQRNFEIQTIDDVTDEGDENFSVRIASTTKPSEVRDIADTALGTILDNDGSCDQNDFCCNFPSSCLSTGGRPGADIEGQIIVDESLCSGDACSSTDTQTVVLGTTNVAVDIREEITRNAYDLIRGREADNLSGTSPKNNLGQNIVERNDFSHNGRNYRRWDIYVNDLPEGGVTYLDGQGGGYFRIGMRRSDGNFGTLNNPATMSGKHTFIVINGSLNIVGDMAYNGPDDSLGVIVLNSNIENLQDLSRRGQLTIYKNVQHTVGAYFTDGSFVSNVWADAGNGGGRINAGLNANQNDDWDIVNGFNASGDMLGRQLVLTGNLLSKNTLGAADLVPPKSPWNEELVGQEGLLRAQMYDLNYIRRYVKEVDPLTLQHTNQSLCTRLPGESDCYDNEKSFVIRIDPRLRENAPPGFEVRSITKLR